MRSKSHLDPKPTPSPSAPATKSSLRQILTIGLLALVALAAALTPIAAQTADAQSSPVIVETFALQIHGNGSQMEIKRVELHNDHTLVVFEVLNGRDFDTQFNATTADTRIEDDRGRSYRVSKAFQATIEPGNGATISLVFAPIPRSSESLSFYFRDRGGDDDSNDVAEGFPSFAIEDIDLTQDIAEPAHPARLAPEETETHPNGTSFTVESLEFENAFTRVEFQAGNPTDRRVDLSNGRHASFIQDNLGNRYYLKLADREVFLRLPKERRFEGTLTFSGRIHPDATSIELIMNDDKSLTDDQSFAPKFELGPWTIAEGVGGDIEPLEIDETQIHPNDSELTIERVEFTDEEVLLDFNFENAADRLLFLNGCCDNSYLLDDLGNRYLLLRPEDNSSLRVQRGRGIGGTLAFVGEIDSNATELTIVFNDRDEDDGDDELTSYPEFRFGPYELERSDEGSTTDGSIDDILDSFNARDGRRRVTLTIPADDLFEPGESDLDQGPTFDDLLLVLERYEDDEMLIIAHTDSEDSSLRNQRLSERQAEALVDALSDSGLDADLIEADGEGDDKPIVDNDGRSSDEANRRISITIFTSEGLPD